MTLKVTPFRKSFENSRLSIVRTTIAAFSCLTALTLTAPISAKDFDARVFTKYGVTIAGIPIGNARVTTHFKDGRYNIVANGRTAGVSKLVSDGRGTLTTDGRIRKGRVLPTRFAMDTVDDKIVTHVRMDMRRQSITKLLAVPPLAKRSDRIPVKDQHYRKVFDPLSAFMVPLDTDGRIKPEKACTRTIPVFDGWQRFDVKLSFKEKRNVKLGGDDGYSGPVVVCKVRYVPVAGHRPSRKATVFLSNNEKMEMWLAPVVGVPVLVPVYAKIGTLLGPLSLTTRIFDTQIAPDKRAQAN